MDRPIHTRTFVFLGVSVAFMLAGSCATSTPEGEFTDEASTGTAESPTRFLPPKTEIAFPPLPLKRKAQVVRVGSAVAGYDLTFADRRTKSAKSRSSCRFTCIGGDCAVGENSESQLFLVQGTFVVTYSRMVEPNRLVAFLASLNRTFSAPVVFLECRFGTKSGKVSREDFLAQLPPETHVDAEKNASFSLAESLPGSGQLYEIAVHKCVGQAGNPYRRVALFAYGSKGLLSFDARGKPVEEKIACRRSDGPCRKVSDFLESNGVSACLF